MCTTFLDVNSGSGHLLVGNISAIANPAVDDPCPLLPKHEALKELSDYPHWRFLDRPDRVSEGVLILIPPCLEQPMDAWYVARLGRVMTRLSPDQPLTREQREFLGDPQVGSQNLWDWIQDNMSYEFDNGREPLAAVFNSSQERRMQGIQATAGRLGIEIGEEQREWLHSREYCYSYTAKAILHAMLDEDLLDEIEQAGLQVTPALYNWLAFPQGLPHYPEQARRLEALRLDPALVEKYAMLKLENEDPEDWVHALNSALNDPGKTVEEALAEFRKLGQPAG